MDKQRVYMNNFLQNARLEISTARATPTERPTPRRAPLPTPQGRSPLAARMIAVLRDDGTARR